ncbi:hypothetical protein LJC25_04775 [Bacteroidales bacterium OttesenSCG-928-K03]|nr:hypothetical protein [Bacteroidales bacterium OttesenSCG-928-L14]MDL2240331.1 hypothetical protein [Bacteroidales bacterium OttesenSCG-928-K22]MDL2243024.1 hypothetical protein [Bacteroidales bacterium OttesenSCG-928-K03]
MQNNLLLLLINNDIKSAAELFVSLNDEKLNDTLEPILEYLVKTETDTDMIINKMISMTEVSGIDKINIINGLLYNFSGILFNAYIDDKETPSLKNSIFKLYENLYEPLFKLYKSDENSYRLNVINWHSEFARYNFIFAKQEEAIKQWETAKKLCCKYLNEDEDENILSNLYLVYFNLGLAYSYEDNKEQALLNFLPYLFHLESDMKYSESNELEMDFATVCRNVAAVCAEENKDYYLIKAFNIYYDYYKNHANEEDIQPVVDNLHEVLNDLIGYFNSISNQKSEYIYLKFKYDFANVDLANDATNIYTMVHYMNAGYAFCKFLIINKELFEEKRTEVLHKESNTYSVNISAPIGEINIYDYMLEYYDNVKSLYEKYNDYRISMGFADANLILGKYNYFANNPQKALTYLSQAKNILLEILDGDREDLECIDKLYDVVYYQRNCYSFDGQTENMIDAVNEMIDIRKIALAIDETDVDLITDLAKTYLEAAEFCESHNFMKMAKKFNDSYNELIG